jgi:hypothetical protein
MGTGRGWVMDFEKWYAGEVAAGVVPQYDVSDYGPDWPALMRLAWAAATAAERTRCAAANEIEKGAADENAPPAGGA